MMAHCGIQSAGDVRQGWRTPRPLFDALHAALRFTVDACASPDNALLPRHWTDCEAARWEGERVFCNPPFRLAQKIVSKAAGADVACLLLPVTCLTTRYLADAPPSFILAPRRKVQFDPPPGEAIKHHNPMLGTLILLWGRLVKLADVQTLERDLGDCKLFVGV